MILRYFILLLLCILPIQLQAFDEKRVNNILENFAHNLSKKNLPENKKSWVFFILKSKVEALRDWKNSEIIEYILEKINLLQTEYNYNNLLEKAGIAWVILDLQVLKWEFKIWTDNYLSLREFTQNWVEKLLVLNLQNYETEIILSKKIWLKKLWGIYTHSKYKEIQDTIFQKTPEQHAPLQNNGLRESIWEKHEHWAFLTADFCPSEKKGFESKIIESFIEKWHYNIWIALTSAWYKRHKEDFQQLLNWKQEWKLWITWINHTKTHNYNPWTDFLHNFILTPWLELKEEILNVEKILLSYWEAPSIFMRFPGLVSDEETRKSVIYDYWLIPLWSNAWLAKGEKVEDGSIILIHGNKNEPKGIELMNKILEKGKWNFIQAEKILY